jgi:predicted lipoprotein with Yx(FWY)xxD motif
METCMRLYQRPVRSLVAIPALLALALSGIQATPQANAAAAPVKVAAGNILKTPQGLTLYVFAADSPNKSTCYKTCAKYWPPLLVPKGTKPAAKMPGIPGTFGVAMRKDGSQQLTYDRAPLYTFLQDKDAGDAYGQGLVAAGGYWWVVVAAGK